MKVLFPYLTVFSFFFLSTNVYAQQYLDTSVASLPTALETMVSYEVADRETPVFLAEYSNFTDYFNQRVTYPEIAIENAIEGTVLLSLWVTPQGWVQDICVLDSPNALLTEAARKAAQDLPQLLPAMVAGTPVGKQILVPIDFFLR